MFEYGTESQPLNNKPSGKASTAHNVMKVLAGLSPGMGFLVISATTIICIMVLAAMAPFIFFIIEILA
jgi:hypothetical protein|tara:strand:- start:294 stop:497 length:204 start_codon:yes stop_codon:yes gene_type:complete